MKDHDFDWFNYYQNANAEVNAVKASFLVRQYEYGVVLDDLLRHTGRGSVQHYLILGRRGSGKSTLLRRIQTEIDTDRHLSLHYIALNPAEEQASIYRLFDLLEEIVRYLESLGYDIVWPSGISDDTTYSNALFSVIHEVLQSVDRKLVLLLDNIDRVFENLGGDVALLRAYMQNFGDIKIVGASTRMTEHFWSYDQPFYEFFRVMRLRPLDKEEVRKLLLDWGDKLGTPLLKEFIEKRPGRLEAIRILTDGLPRTLQFFVDILLRQEAQTGYDYVRQIMDKITPLYQERLNNLPPAQRKIILQLAFCWEAVGAGELAKAARMENRVVSAQLNQLIEKGVVDKVQTSTKNHLYRLSERFFNLWLIFTQGSPKERSRAKYLTIFLENFYDMEELVERARLHLELVSGKSVDPNKAVLLTKAYAQVSYISAALRDSLIEQTRKLTDINEFLKDELPPTTREIAVQVEKLAKRKEWAAAESLARSIEQESGFKTFLLGWLAYGQNEFSKAKELLSIAFEGGAIGGALMLSQIYLSETAYDLAEKYAEAGIEADLASSAMQLALIYYARNKYREKALLLVERAVDENPNDKSANYMLPVLQAWNGAFKEMENSVNRLIRNGAEPDYMVHMLSELVVHHQWRFVSDILQTDAIGGQFQGRLFHVLNLAGLMLDGDRLRLPPELRETVEKNLLSIYAKRDFYYGTQEAANYLKKKNVSSGE